jgi:NAD(P)-dependent dehydrogenase (short-subunit alcohol dehydrogenase family)
LNIKSIQCVVNNAAQTIKVREETAAKGAIATNRYGDSKHVAETSKNSWAYTIFDIDQKESEECYRINAVAPMLLVKSIIDLLKGSEEIPYILNVHAREGKFMCRKSKYHMHTNMAKAGLAMFTKTLIAHNLETNSGKPIRVHGCDPGWISIDEYYETSSPWIIPPLDEIDGAKRILYPMINGYASYEGTWKHFERSGY